MAAVKHCLVAVACEVKRWWCVWWWWTDLIEDGHCDVDGASAVVFDDAAVLHTSCEASVVWHHRHALHQHQPAQPAAHHQHGEADDHQQPASLLERLSEQHHAAASHVVHQQSDAAPVVDRLTAAHMLSINARSGGSSSCGDSVTIGCTHISGVGSGNVGLSPLSSTGGVGGRNRVSVVWLTDDHAIGGVGRSSSSSSGSARIVSSRRASARPRRGGIVQAEEHILQTGPLHADAALPPAARRSSGAAAAAAIVSGGVSGGGVGGGRRRRRRGGNSRRRRSGRTTRR